MKQGQSLTFFIIIGILMILLVSVGIYFTGEREELRFEEGVSTTIEQVPQEAQPVYQFVESCIRQVGEQALRKMGSQAGYLETDDFKIDPLIATEGQALSFTFPADLKIPYWYAMNPPDRCEKRGGCSFISYRPNLYKSSGEPSIEGQLDRYVESNLQDCIVGFAPFRARGYDITIEEDPKVDARVGVDDVSIFVEMPITVDTPSGEHRIEKYFTQYPGLKMKEIYELATNISTQQAEYNFLEKGTYNLINLFAGVDAELPPVETTEFAFGGNKYWVKSKVRETIRDHILTPYVPMLQVFGTRNYRPITIEDELFTETKNLVYNRGMLVPITLNKTYPDLSATFSYLPLWEPYFDLNCDGELCSGMTGSTMILILFGIQRYQFAYDISYPVLSLISQPEAFDGRGYTFQFGLEANIRNNEPMNPSTQLFAPPEVTTSVLAAHPFADIEQRNSGVFTINVFEGKTALADIPIPAKGAMISFHCGDQKIAVGTAENGTLVTRLPRCLGGLIDARRKEGGNGNAKVNTFTDVPQEVNITIESYRIMDFDFKKIPMDRIITYEGEGDNLVMEVHWTIDPRKRRVSLRDHEEATIIMKKKPDFIGEEPHTIVSTIYGNDKTTIDHCTGEPKQDKRKDLKMLPGTYTTQVIVMSYANISILEETRKEGSLNMKMSGVDETGQEVVFGAISGGLYNTITEFGSDLFATEIDVPGIDFNCSSPLITSSYEMNITFPARFLDNSKVIEWSAITFDLEGAPIATRKVEEMQVMQATSEYNEIYKRYIRPKFQLS